MESVDMQAEKIKEEWEKEDGRSEPEIVERGVFGEEGWSISVSNKNIGGGSEEPKSGMGTPSNEERL